MKRELRLHWLLLNGKVAEVEKEAQKENRTVTNMVETILLEATEK